MDSTWLVVLKIVAALPVLMVLLVIATGGLVLGLGLAGSAYYLLFMIGWNTIQEIVRLIS